MEWCEDKETARAAELLYGHIDNMELYPGKHIYKPMRSISTSSDLALPIPSCDTETKTFLGLQAECTKPAIPGSGVCPGQTTGRGILDDAVSLVRADRFLTYDFNSSTCELGFPAKDCFIVVSSDFIVCQ